MNDENKNSIEGLFSDEFHYKDISSERINNLKSDLDAQNDKPFKVNADFNRRIISEQEKNTQHRLFDISTDYDNPDERQQAIKRREQIKREINTSPDALPYAYNYKKTVNENAIRVAQRNGFENIETGKEKGQRKHFGHGKRIVVFFLVLLLIFGGIGALGINAIKKVYSKVKYEPLSENKHINVSELKRKEGVKNILFVGVDARPGENDENSRSDTMMLITIDENNKQIKMTSFLRDTYIEIPGFGMHKLNAAEAKGGRQLLVDTLEYNYKIDIDNYALVNFEMFKGVIDGLGGIDVEVSEKEAEYINDKKMMTSVEREAFPSPISAGKNHFSGGQALWFSRIRYLDDDYHRTARQRQVISQIILKAKSANPSELYKLADAVMPQVKTDLTENDLIKFTLKALIYLKYDTAQQQIPAPDTFKSERKRAGAVLTPDLPKNISILEKFVFEKVESEKERKVKK